MDNQEAQRLEWEKIADTVAADLDADILLYNGDIEWSHTDSPIDLCDRRDCRPNVFLVLVTYGGDPHAAYRISRCLQRRYKKLTVYISGVCKSAGTIVTLGAHEIVMSDHGELGPLDIQLRKPDELWEKSSGLTVMEALTSLQQRSFSMFEDYFLDLKRNSGGQITLRTAMQIASSLTAELFRPLYGQIDPMNIGENGRAIRISQHYGKILNEKSQNLKDGALEKLIAFYPSHSVVIDRDEAKLLFRNVREPTEHEKKLARSLGSYARVPSSDTGPPTVLFLSVSREKVAEESYEQQDHKGHPEGRGEETETSSGTAGERYVSESEQSSLAKVLSLEKTRGQSST